MKTPENSKRTFLRIKVKTIQLKDGRIKIINEGDEEPCDPTKVHRLIDGKRVETQRVVENAEETDKQPENEPADPEVDAILADFIKNMP